MRRREVVGQGVKAVTQGLVATVRDRTREEEGAAWLRSPGVAASRRVSTAWRTPRSTAPSMRGPRCRLGRPRPAVEETRLALIASPGEVHRLSPKFSDVGRASRVAQAFTRARPNKLSPTATGSFDARAFFDTEEGKWRIAARYVPAEKAAAPGHRPGA